MDVARLSPPRRLMLPSALGETAVLDFGDPKRPVDLVFVHANGFNAMTYRGLLAPLSQSLRIWAPDLRGHGRTTLPTSTAGRRSWRDLRDDLVELIEQLDGPPVVLSGHSMGATAGLLAAAERPGRVASLVLFDPVIWSRWTVAAFQLPLLDQLAGRIPLVKNALKRRAVFGSREQAMRAYEGRGAFKGWPGLTLADYLADGLIETDEGLTLACRPEWEASNYASQSHDPWTALKRFARPVRILKAATGSTCHVPDSAFAHVAVETPPGSNHFLPMLRPDLCRDALFEAAV